MKIIGMLAPIGSPGLRGMLDTLGEVLDVRFEERKLGDDLGVDAWILREAEPGVLDTIAQCRRPCYTVVSGSQLIPCGESPSIEFSLHQALPSVIRGRQIEVDAATKVNALPQWVQALTPLASKGGAPIWAVQDMEGRHCHFVSLPLPELMDGGSLFQYFYAGEFISLLPLLVFLRSVSDDQRWEPLPLQACFMFDDPNLHWRNYGYIDFAEITRHAQAHNYHVSFATIPLDAWFVHTPTALYFRQHSKELSLLIHGNDHIAKELALPHTEEHRFHILRQALRRIEKLERRSGVDVSRVMVPPHGALSESTLATMSRLGFEAACVSRWSIRHFNPNANWLRTFGMRPADTIAGLTVFPRFRLSPTCHNSILVAALLRQPIIAVGHHNDLVDGLDLLDDLARFVNSLGPVQWADMKRISRSVYSRRYDGSSLRIRMFTKRVEILVPEGIDSLSVDDSRPDKEEFEHMVWRRLGGDQVWNRLAPDQSLPVLGGEIIEIASILQISSKSESNSYRRIRIWPVVRRHLAEARDRLNPALNRLFPKRTGFNCS